MLALLFPVIPVSLLFVVSWWLYSSLHHEVAAGLATRARRPSRRGHTPLLFPGVTCRHCSQGRLSGVQRHKGGLEGGRPCQERRGRTG